MMIRTKLSCVFWITSYYLLIAAPVIGSEWKLPIKVAVQSGQFARLDCPVGLDFDNPIPTNEEWQILELTAGTPQPAPAQIDSSNPRRMWWILTGETAAGVSRKFEIRPGKPSVADQITVERLPDSLTVRSGESNILRYHTAHVVPPQGIDKRFGRSAYIHPVWTPRGAIVTDEFPRDFGKSRTKKDVFVLSQCKTLSVVRCSAGFESTRSMSTSRFQVAKLP
jgi:hypothetical protein